MHWGHAVSRDLVQWQELDIALYPDEMGPMFSGSAVVDWNNTVTLSDDDKPAIVLFYTAAGEPTVWAYLCRDARNSINSRAIPSSKSSLRATGIQRSSGMSP